MCIRDRYGPWLKLKVGEREILDDSFKGLGRPWMGLHTVDTVRRDAAEQRMRFETRLTGGNNAEVKVSSGEGELVYTIDMVRDIVEKIRIATSDGREGELRFEYLEGISGAGKEFARPRRLRGKEGSLFDVLRGAR